MKTWPLTTVRRWAASPNSFTLDFGDYSESYYSVQTTEGETISQLIAGYIDIIIKKVLIVFTVKMSSHCTAYLRWSGPHGCTYILSELHQPFFQLASSNVIATYEVYNTTQQLLFLFE